MNSSVNHLTVSLMAEAAPAGTVALCAAIGLSGAEPPEYIHLLPAGEIRSGDGRGPYRIRNVQALLEKFLQAGERLVIDENHSTDLAAPKGLPAPAMGWIVALENRADGIWGKAEWTPRGRRLVGGRAYRGISPVILHDKAGNIDAVLRASLVNKPNLKGLVTLHQEQTDMDLLAKLIAALKLPTDTSEDALVTAITTLHSQQADHRIALQAQVDPLAEAAGLAKGAKVEEVVAAIKQLVASDADAATIVSLQGELKTLGTELNALRDEGRRKAATSFVDAAIAAKRVGVSAQRERFIAMHMADPAGAEAIINDLPALGRSAALPTPPGKSGDGKRVLTLEQEAVVSAMQLNRDAYIAQLDAQEQREAAL